jgi:hypothetical protein
MLSSLAAQWATMKHVFRAAVLGLFLPNVNHGKRAGNVEAHVQHATQRKLTHTNHPFQEGKFRCIITVSEFLMFIKYSEKSEAQSSFGSRLGQHLELEVVTIQSCLPRINDVNQQT